MNAIIKNVLGAALVITVLGFTYAATQYAGVYQKAVDPASFRSFSVSGDGKAVAIPDIAQFSFMVITEGGKQVGALQQENTTKVNKAILFVKSKSIDALFSKKSKKDDRIRKSNTFLEERCVLCETQC